MPGTQTTYVRSLTRRNLLWATAGVAGAGYGTILIVTALRMPAGSALTGLFPAQPAVKALMAVLLAAAVLGHVPVRERRWLLGALLFSATGDVLLAIPWWPPSFVGGLGAFLVAHLCYLGALLPLVAASRPRLVAAVAVCVACAALLMWFWPKLATDGLTVPVTVYIAVLGAMVGAALLARLPTPWTALGAQCFAVSDSMIGIGRFVLDSEALAVPIWWAYALSQVLITAGFFFGRAAGGREVSRRGPAGGAVAGRDASAHSATPAE